MQQKSKLTEVRQVFEKDPEEFTDEDFDKIVEVLKQRLEKIRQARQDTAIINQKIDKIKKGRKKNAKNDTTDQQDGASTSDCASHRE